MKKVLLFLLLINYCNIAFGEKITYEGVSYEIINDKECWLVKDTENLGYVTESNYEGLIVIPASINYEGKEYSVVKIDNYAFYKCKVTFLSLPNTIREIGIKAFSNSSLIERVVLPNKIEFIPQYCFSGCISLKTIEIPFSVKRIDEGAFQYSGITSLDLPNQIIKIGDYAFANCNSLASIKIPDGLEKLGKAVFRDCPKLDEILVSDNCCNFMKWNSCLTSKPLNTIYYCPNSYQGDIIFPEDINLVEDGAFYGCSLITEIKFNDSLKRINNCAFSNCTNLKEIILPKELTYLGENAFDGCTSITNIVLQNKLKEIGFGCFYYTQISNITIPGSLELLADKVFYLCNNLRTVNIRGIEPPSRTQYLFPLNWTIDVHVLKGMKAKYEDAKYWRNDSRIYDDLDWIKVQNIIIEKEEYVCNINEVYKAEAVILPEDADAQYPIWSSSDESIVYIDKGGNFVGLREGVANIIATAKDDSGVFAMATVKVTSSSAINNNFTDSEKVLRYDINGMLIKDKRKGINIIKSAGKTYKKIAN